MRAAKVDANQKEIVAVSRKMGASIEHCHMVGEGFPDIVLGFNGVNYLIEIKDGSKPPSQRKLTPAQVRWHQSWKGSVYIIKSIEEMIDFMEIVARGTILFKKETICLGKYLTESAA